MKVFSFIGPSGTGKSHRANFVAHKIGAEVIVDDGLLIKDNRIIAGISSKIQSTRIGAIKTALFMSDEQAEQVKKKIKFLNVKSVLILSTSNGMAKKIASRLDLDPIVEFLYIEDFASIKEIRKARSIRSQYSKHVIPAPTMEVKKSLPETLVDPLQVFLRRKSKLEKSDSQHNWLEQSVVRPTFTYYGKLTISQHALSSISKISAEQVKGVYCTKGIHLKRVADGINIYLNLVLQHGLKMDCLCKNVQTVVKEQLENMTGLYVAQVNIFIIGVRTGKKVEKR
ncbi:MAG: Asp23/Gls24 family envelope stress response protein [Clostridiales bacterium]|nr:Asp23/Gls24 family envelope stress response protein [Clostridiales bacterium]MCF8021957.1 Asp23/Gls24 family envelope stress response protein [Clostridiales bacterium]